METSDKNTKKISKEISKDEVYLALKHIELAKNKLEQDTHVNGIDKSFDYQAPSESIKILFDYVMQSSQKEAAGVVDSIIEINRQKFEEMKENKRAKRKAKREKRKEHKRRISLFDEINAFKLV